jgi:hypothetical protein
MSHDREFWLTVHDKDDAPFNGWTNYLYLYSPHHKPNGTSFWFHVDSVYPWAAIWISLSKEKLYTPTIHHYILLDTIRADCGDCDMDMTLSEVLWNFSKRMRAEQTGATYPSSRPPVV